MQNVFELVDSNKRKSNFVILGFIAFIVLITYVFSQIFEFSPSIVGIALIFSGVTSFLVTIFPIELFYPYQELERQIRKKIFIFIQSQKI